jgi:hypothetical protein
MGLKPLEEFRCETCVFRMRAEERPNSFSGRFWRWHTTWCPGWKAYQKALAENQIKDVEH